MSNKIVVKCFYNGEVRAVGTIKSSTTLKSLKKRVRKEFHRDLDLKYKDSDGDIIALKKPSHLRDAIKGNLVPGYNKLPNFSHAIRRLICPGLCLQFCIENAVQHCLTMERRCSV
jgi:hypothetical protein